MTAKRNTPNTTRYFLRLVSSLVPSRSTKREIMSGRMSRSGTSLTAFLKGSQDCCFRRKALTEAALLCDVVGNNVAQAHSSAPRSISATWRKPCKSIFV